MCWRMEVRAAGLACWPENGCEGQRKGGWAKGRMGERRVGGRAGGQEGVQTDERVDCSTTCATQDLYRVAVRSWPIDVVRLADVIKTLRFQKSQHAFQYFLNKR